MANPNSTSPLTHGSTPTLARTRLTAAAEAIRQPTIPADAGQVDAMPVSAGSAPRPTVAPYHCDTCGSDNPYRSGRMKHRGGLGCKACRAVTKAIQDAHLSTLRRLTAPAYRPGVHGEQKQAIIRFAEAVAHQAWAAASASYGIAVPSSTTAALVAELRVLAATGVISSEDLVSAGTDLLNIAQDAELARVGSERAA